MLLNLILEERALQESRSGKIDLEQSIKDGTVNFLTPRQMTSEIQLRSRDKVALVFGDMETGAKELRRTGFKGDIRHAADSEALITMMDSGELAEVDIIINTTNENIRHILRGIEAAVIDMEVMVDRHRFQRAVIDICA